MEALFGTQNHVDPAQECARAALIFFYGLVMLRLSGRRTFAQWSALDLVVSFIVGSALSRAMTGSAPLPGTLAAVAVLVFLHVLLSHAVARSPRLSRLVEGTPVRLVRDGMLDRQARLRHGVSESDLCEALREKNLAGLDDLARVKEMTLEPNGKLTVRKG